MRPRKEDYWDMVRRVRELLDHSIRQGSLPRVLKAENQVITPDIVTAAAELKEIILRGDRDALRSLHCEPVGGFDRAEESEHIPELEEARREAEQEILREREEQERDEEPS